MTFEEFYNKMDADTTTYPYDNLREAFKTFPYFEGWILYEYMNFNILFDPITFAKKLLALILNKRIELDRIEKIVKFITDKEINEDDLNNIVTQTSESKANTSGKVSNSYSGYNVDNGEFNNSTNSGDSTSSGTTSTSSVNRVEQLYNMANYELRSLFNNINVELIKLFQLIY